MRVSRADDAAVDEGVDGRRGLRRATDEGVVLDGICVADESQRKTIPAARDATPAVSRSGVMVNCASLGPTPRASDTARNTDSWAVHATKQSLSLVAL